MEMQVAIEPMALMKPTLPPSPTSPPSLPPAPAAVEPTPAVIQEVGQAQQQEGGEEETHYTRSRNPNRPAREEQDSDFEYEHFHPVPVKMEVDDAIPSSPEQLPTPTPSIPSFVSADPLSEDSNSSSDSDSDGHRKPPRAPKYDSKGVRRPTPSYYYDAEYDVAGKGKKRRRRGGQKGIPVFEPTMEDFEGHGGFYGFVKRIEKYGMRSGIVKVIPPKEWTDALPPTTEPLHSIRLREPIEQNILGSSGLFRVTNVAKTRIFNPAQWKDFADGDKWKTPDFLGLEKEKSNRAAAAVAAEKEKPVRRRSVAVPPAEGAAVTPKRSRAKKGKGKAKSKGKGKVAAIIQEDEPVAQPIEHAEDQPMPIEDIEDKGSDGDDEDDEEEEEDGVAKPALDGTQEEEVEMSTFKEGEEATEGAELTTTEKVDDTDVIMKEKEAFSNEASTSKGAAPLASEWLASPSPSQPTSGSKTHLPSPADEPSPPHTHDSPHPTDAPTPAPEQQASAPKKRRPTNMQRAEPTFAEWEAFSEKYHDLPNGMKKEDYTVEMMREIERRYWRTLTFGEPPWYGADMKGSLFTDATKAWNVAHLGDLLPQLAPASCRIPGVVSPYLYFGMWRATFAWHVEDADLYSINYIHFGAPKFWYAVPQEESGRFERTMEGFFPTDRGKCTQFLRHKAFLASPRVLANAGITLNRCAQLPGEFILTYPRGYHSGFNVGFNAAESINFATERWLPIGKAAKSCFCVGDSVSIDVDVWLREAALAEEVAKGVVATHVALVVNANANAASRKRSSPSKSETPSLGAAPPLKKKKIMAPPPVPSETIQVVIVPSPLTKKAIKEAEKVAKADSWVCALCPDMSMEGLVDINEPGVKTKKKLRAHRVCVMFTPATWIDVDPVTNEEIVRGYGRIEKARWKLSCQLCKEKHGTKVQCTKGKCPKAFHVTCALQEHSGIFLDASIVEDGVRVSLLEMARKEIDAEKDGKEPPLHKVAIPHRSVPDEPTPTPFVPPLANGTPSVMSAAPPAASSTTDIAMAPAETSSSTSPFPSSLSHILGSSDPHADPSTSNHASTSLTAPLVLDGSLEYPPASASETQAPAQASATVQSDDGGIKLTVLCRIHNPDYQKMENARKAAELKGRVDLLPPNARIRVKTSGGVFEVTYSLCLAFKEAVSVIFDDGKRSDVKWKNIVWPDSPEVARKKEEAAEKARVEGPYVYEHRPIQPTKRSYTGIPSVLPAPPHLQSQARPVYTSYTPYAQPYYPYAPPPPHHASQPPQNGMSSHLQQPPRMQIPSAFGPYPSYPPPGSYPYAGPPPPNAYGMPFASSFASRMPPSFWPGYSSSAPYYSMPPPPGPIVPPQSHPPGPPQPPTFPAARPHSQSPSLQSAQAPVQQNSSAPSSSTPTIPSGAASTSASTSFAPTLPAPSPVAASAENGARRLSAGSSSAFPAAVISTSIGSLLLAATAAGVRERDSNPVVAAETGLKAGSGDLQNEDTVMDVGGKEGQA